MGTALILRVTLDDVMQEEGIDARIECADFGTGFTLKPDLFVITPEMEERAKSTGIPFAMVVNVAMKDESREKVIPLVKEMMST